ncbi:MAG TPA: Mur ligase family protein [Oscillospiraceae bacterium]|nr:Mur ligase family protein [Oscillospiraceae bacterium]
MSPLTNNIPLLGVTGTNGKTTTILILGFILEQCGLKPTVLDSWKGTVFLEQAMQQAAAQASDCLLIEVPVDALRRKQLNGRAFQCGALTNLSLDHLTSCHTPDRYLDYKAGFFAQLPERAKAVINADDPSALSLAQEGHVDYITYATHYHNAMIIATNVKQLQTTTNFELKVNEEFVSLNQKIISPASATVQLPLLGLHNVANALLAATLALLFVPDLQAVAQALNRFPGIRRKMEVIPLAQGYLLDDAAHNPAAIQAALATIKDFAADSIYLLHGIYGGGGPKLNEYNARELAHWIQQNPQCQLFITRSMYHCKSKQQVRLHEEKAILRELKEKDIDFAYFPDLADAIDSLLTHLHSSNDLLVFLGGHVLDRASDLLIRAAGERPEGNLLIPSELALLPRELDTQTISHNPS